ncbi:hypothetical protein V1289_000314 [Bradyrhizobium sp. AZCC 2289]
MCNLYSITTNQEAIRALFRVINRYVGNLPPMPGVGVFPDYPARGHAATAARWRSACHQHPQHRLTALADVAEAGETLLGPRPTASLNTRPNRTR